MFNIFFILHFIEKTFKEKNRRNRGDGMTSFIFSLSKMLSFLSMKEKTADAKQNVFWHVMISLKSFHCKKIVYTFYNERKAQKEYR